jgi:hypothetical protein
MNQDTTTPAEPQEVAYHTTEDAAQALLARWNSRADTPTADDSESEAQDADEPADEPVAEQADEATADATSTEASEVDEVEIDVAGEKFKLPKTLQEQAQRIQQKAKDLEAGTTRKFQEAAEIRKAVEAERELTSFIGKLAVQQTDALADLRSTVREVERLQGMDLQSLHDTDPVTASKVTARLVQLQAAQRQIEQQLAQATQQIKQAEQQHRAQMMERGQAQLAKLVPNLTDATKQELAQYIAQRSLTPEGQAALYDPEVVAAFHDAKRYRDAMAAKPVAKRTIEPSKTLKPGTAAAPSTSAKARVEALKTRAFKTGSTEDIAAALLARANLRK